MTFNDLYVKLGNLIMYFQRIETDLKITYSWINKYNDFSNNMNEIEKITLGEIIGLIKDFQIENKMEILSFEDMKLLNSLRKRRNFWVHSSFDFIYLEKTKMIEEYNRTLNLVLKDLKEFSNLAHILQKFRLKVVKNL